MKRIITALVTTVLAVGLALPASAGQPGTFTTPPETFEDVNACTGEQHEVTIWFDVWQKETVDHTVWQVESHTTTSDGWAGGGHETGHDNDDTVSVSYNIMTTDGGSGRYRVHGNMKLDPETGEARVDDLDVECVRY